MKNSKNKVKNTLIKGGVLLWSIVLISFLLIIGGGILLYKYLKKKKQSVPTGSSSYIPDGNLPRGLRNNNALNIRISNDKWKGLSAKQKDESFFSFKALKWGYRAAFKILKTYQTKYQIETVMEILKRWAPKSDGNRPTIYFETVQNYMAEKNIQINKTSKVNLKNIKFMTALIHAMAIVENGHGYKDNIKDKDIIDGINLA